VKQLTLFCLICIEPTPQNAKKWTLESLVSDVVTEEYNKQGKGKYIERALQVLDENQIEKLKDWASLSEESKKKYPDILRDILDDASLPQGILLILRFHCFCNDY
jgi:hypothetical protein